MGDSAWGKAPPDPLSAPGYYDGLLWRRSLGFLIDVMLVWALNAALAVAFWLGGVLTLGLLWPLGALALAILPVAYHTYFIGHGGATPGMAFFDVQLRDWTGKRLDYGQAFLQTALFYTTVSLTGGLILVVGLFNDRRRTLHDILAGTLALRRTPAP
jgi:uncharacterized RDD family membrane protein YckC